MIDKDKVETLKISAVILFVMLMLGILLSVLVALVFKLTNTPMVV